MILNVLLIIKSKIRFVKKTLDSIYYQSYQNFEIIFVYDDKNKSDLQTIKTLLAKFKRKKILVNKKNLGVSKSRNKALKNCKGKYIAFIDADDIWKSNKLYKQIKFMEKKLSYFSFTSYNIIDSQDKLINKRIVNYDPTYKKLMKKKYYWVKHCNL